MVRVPNTNGVAKKKREEGIPGITEEESGGGGGPLLPGGGGGGGGGEGVS